MRKGEEVPGPGTYNASNTIHPHSASYSIAQKTGGKSSINVSKNEPGPG